MNCADAREHFSAYLDEALESGERAAVEAHLVTCAECSRELGRLRATVSILQRVEPARAPAGFVDRVLEAARPIPWHRRIGRFLFFPLGAKLPLEAAAVVLIGFLALQIFQRAPEMQQAMSERPAAKSEGRPGVAGSPPQETVAVKPAESFRGLAKEMERQTGRAARDTKVATSETQTKPLPPASLPAGSQPTASPESQTAARNAETKKKEADLEGGVPRARDAAAARRQAPQEEPGKAPAPARESPQAPSARPDQSGRPEPGAKSAPGPVVASPPPPRPLSAFANVIGRLSVKDRTAAELELAALVARLGGSVLGQRRDPAATVIDLVIPQSAYAEFTHGLGRLGSWQPEGQPAELPTQVRITLRLSE
ncbi:MAG TPA: zf-HC2 domain-containing protein [Methylomirabilota bacterium]|nr:zf-HC2 domain-containing protein [Methylomirabilota bacterium]